MPPLRFSVPTPRFFALFVKISAQGGTFPVHRSSPSTKNPQTAMCWSFADFLLVIRMGLEPMTRSLEGCCSNPTELPNHPFCISSRRKSIQSMNPPEKRVQRYRLLFKHTSVKPISFLNISSESEMASSMKHTAFRTYQACSCLRSSRTTFSTCWVCGNISTGCTAVTW